MLEALSDTPNRAVLFARLAESMDPADARQLLQALRERTGGEPEG